jgi:6-phosphogluconolactonase
VVEPLRTNLWVNPDAETAARAAAHRLLGLAERAIAARGRFVVALSGGTTPEPMFRELAATEGSAERWRSWQVFWCDERHVPSTDARSNFSLARRLWLEPAGVPRSNVHPVPTSGTPEADARAYEAELRRFFAPETAPSWDATVLGVGPDGHTASLFPGSASLAVTDRWVVAEPNPGQPPRVPRVTLTLAGLSHARVAIFLVCGGAKRPIVSRLLSPVGPHPSKAGLPAARVGAVESIEWFVDQDAAPASGEPVELP